MLRRSGREPSTGQHHGRDGFGNAGAIGVVVAQKLTSTERIERLERALAGLTLASRGVLGKRFFLRNPELKSILEETQSEEMDLRMMS